MNILNLISSSGFYGVENLLLSLGKFFPKNNDIFYLGILENKQNAENVFYNKAISENVKTFIFPGRFKFDFKVLKELHDFINNYSIDILHTHGLKPNFYGYILSKFTKLPIIATTHSWISNPIEQYLKSNNLTLFSALQYHFDQKLLRKFDKIIAISEFIQNKLVGNKIELKKIELIYNGVNISDYYHSTLNIRSEFTINNDSIIVATAARLSIEKGLIYYLEAAKKVLEIYENTIFLLTGSGPLLKKLQTKTLEHGIKKNVLFTGFRTDMAAVYKSIDIFILPSIREGMPMVLLEAMASSKPIIATNVGGISEIITNNLDGLLVEPGNSKDLALSIIRLIQSEKLKESLAKNAYQTVQDRFSVQKTTQKYYKCYREVLSDI